MSYPPEVGASPTGDYVSKREAVLHVMAAASFLVFFQAYLVAPLIPSLSIEFHASTDFLGMLVPAYMLPYGISTLFYGPISDRFGRKAVILYPAGADGCDDSRSGYGKYCASDDGMASAGRGDYRRNRADRSGASRRYFSL